jgi:peptidoglycan/xylan/chitin deacetylase (PgdA/CDA1 family)
VNVPLLSVSVDLDELEHYRAIHGLPEGNASTVFARAVPRLVDWARQRGVALTWFVVGRDLQNGENVAMARRLVSAGDELACHSYSHFYDLTRRTVAEMRTEVDRGLEAVTQATGVRPTGFRAPGYAVNDTLLALLQELGLAYDSSVFPCPPYYLAKAAALAKLSLQRKQSRAILDAPDALRAPTRPYRVGRPYWYRGTGILEVPIQVTRKARLPFIGTALTLAGPLGARLLTRGVLGEPLVNLELHGIDALDERDGLSELARHQPDLRIPWAKKLDAIDAAVSLLLEKGYASVRMDELASAARAGA